MKKLSFLIFLLALGITPLATEAATPWQANIPAIGEKEFVLRYKSLSETQNFTCLVTTLACKFQNTSSSTLPKIKGVSKPAPTKRFSTRFQAATPNKPERIFELTDTQTGKTYKQTEKVKYWDLLSEEFRIFSINPTETRLVYLDDRDGYPTLYHVDLTKLGTDLAGTRLITRPYSISNFIFIDTDRLLFIANREHPLLWNLYEYNLKTETLKKVSDNVSYGVTLKQVGPWFAFGKINNNITNILFYDPATGTTKGATTNRPFPQAAIEPAAETITLGNLYGVVAKPAGFSRTTPYPMILWLHGGPYRQTSVGYHSYPSYAVYDQVLETLRQRGFLIVKLDYSGSYGYGRPFAEKLQGQVGKVEIADVTNAINILKSRYTISSVYPMGNSYGGYLALKAAAEKPTLVEGAISIAGVTDWQALLEKNPDSIFKVHFGGAPSAANKKLFDQASITKLAKNLVGKKILLIHGQMDSWVPVEQADILYRVLPVKTSDFIAIPGEEHILTKQSSLEEICRSLITFFGLAPVPAATSCLR